MQWAVIEADDLVSSHDTDFRLNPEFPQELQPRDRTREEMKKQIFSISGKLNPELLGQSLYASAGAPIVGRDLVVESGNGRMLGLKMRYAQDGATAYREWVGENAKQFGIDPKTIDAMQHPVLVRIRLSEQDRKMVTERANERDIAAMSPVETAKVDSGRLQPEDMELFRPGDDGEIATASNSDFISQFLKTIGPAESAGLLTADGKPTRQLLDRIQAAVFEKAYHDDRLLALMAEDANPDIRNVLKALTMASTVFAKVKGMVGDKEPIEAIDHIVGAVDVIRRAKREGENVETILNQLGLFGEDIPGETASVTRFLVKNARSAKRIGEFLQAVAKKYQYWAANKDQPDLFGNLPEKPVAGTVLKEALADGGVGGNQPGLFEDASSVHPEIDGMRVAVSADVNQAPLNVPPNWIVFNAPRPLYGDREWQGDFLHGRFYAAVDPNGDKAEWCIKENKSLDAWVYQFVDAETMRAMVRQYYIDGYFKGDAEKTDKAMGRLTAEQIRGAFANFLDKMTFGAFQELEAKAVAPQESNTRPSKEPWRLDIMEAKTMDDIAAVFEDLFGVYWDGRDVMESALFESAGSGDFVMAPNGTINFGQITPEIAKVIKRQAGYIRMREGSVETTGEKHINRERRLAQIRQAGYKNAVDLVYTITSGYTEIYKGPGRQLILVNSNKQPITAYVLLEPAKDGDYYDVKTAFPTNTAFLERKELLWGDPPYHQRRNLAPSGDLGHSKSGEKISLPDSDVNRILEDATPETWRQAIKDAKSIADIEAVFRSLFPDAFSGEAEIQYVDTGEKIGGAKKDIWASILSGQRRMDAQALEGMDDATAAKAVTRQNVVRGLIDTFRDSGFEPGAVFMISKLIGSFDAKPADSDAARRSYLIASERVMQYLRSARTVSDFKDALQQIRSEIAGLIMTPEQKALDADYKDRVRQWNDLRHRKWLELINLPELHTDRGTFKRDKANAMLWAWEKTVQEDILPQSMIRQYNQMIHDLRQEAESNPDSFLNQYRALGKGFMDAVSLKSKTFQKHLNDAKAGNITDFSFLDKESTAKSPRTKQDKPKWQRIIPDVPERTGGTERKFSPQELIDLFGIRGVEYGNWMDRESSEHHTQMLGYGFMDMAQVLGIPMNHVSHGGKLAIAFGARGGGSAAAHYEPERKVINLTKLRGGGTLAHEWAHFLDNIIQMVASGGKEKFSYASGNSAAELAWRKKDDWERKRIPKPFAEGLSEDVQQALISLHEAIMRGDAGGKASDPQKNKYRSIGWVDELVQKGMSPQEIMDKSYQHELKGRFMGRVPFADLAAYIHFKTGQQVIYDKKHSHFYATSAAISSRTPDSYWTRPHEMLARAFEAYINDKLQASGIVNTYLVSGVRESDLDDTAPYPRGEERSRINAAFDRLIEALKENQIFEMALLMSNSVDGEDMVLEKARDVSNAIDGAIRISGCDVDPIGSKVAAL